MADSTYNLSLTAEVIDEILVWLNNNYDTIIKQGDLLDATGSSSTGAMTQEAITDALAAKQDYLTFDDAPTNGSTNPVTSGGVYTALDSLYTTIDGEKQDVLSFDSTPTSSSTNPVTSGGVAAALQEIEDDVYTLEQDKQDKDVDAVEGNLAMFNDDYETIDAGIAADDIVVREGIYPTLAAGAITKVLAGQEFTNRTTANGAGIVDGLQQLKAIYGNSQQFNQHIEDSSISGNATHTGSNTYFITTLGTNSHSFYGHKVYVRGKVTMTIAPARLTIQVDNTTITIFNDVTANTEKDIACIGSVTSSAWYGVRLYATGLTAEDGCVMTWEDVNIFDLTAMGIDSLTTTSEVEAWLAEHIGSNDYYDYNAGEILNNVTTGLQTTDGDSTTSTLTLDLTSMTSDGTAICADGMKSAGSESIVRDTLVVDSDGYARTYIQYVDTRAYEDGDEDDTSVTTDGSTYTNYALDTPVTYTLDTPIYCGFTAYNGGTEVQVPANGSTPTTAAFYADIIYRVAASSVITEGSLTNLLNALKSAGKITSYTLSFDESTGDYEFTIS